MIVEPITYKTFNGEEVTENFYFNLTEAELAQLQLKTPGGYKEKIEAIVKAKDQQALILAFTDIIDLAYGIKSDDGKRFIKTINGAPVVEAFKQTQAYSDLYMSLIFDEQKAVKFINGLIPEGLSERIDKANPMISNA